MPFSTAAWHLRAVRSAGASVRCEEAALAERGVRAVKTQGLHEPRRPQCARHGGSTLHKHLMPSTTRAPVLQDADNGRVSSMQPHEPQYLQLIYSLGVH